MRIHVIPTPFYAANCVILIPDGSTAALVVDPSAGVQDEIRQILRTEGRHVAAVLCTHGHSDHVWDAAAVSAPSFLDGEADSDGGEAPAPVYVPQPDMYRFEDPSAYTMPLSDDMLAAFGPWVKPQDLRPFPTDSVEVVDGVWLRMLPAPGHTEGSAFFLGHADVTLVYQGKEISSTELPVPWALAGDVLFAGSVGRTDLHGGDETQMRHSLRTISHAIDPRTMIIPGHGPLTTLAQEIDTNPYLTRARKIG